MLRVLAFVALFVLALALQAPAWLLERALPERTAGLVTLAESAGTLWNGKAVVIVRGQGVGGRDSDPLIVHWRLAAIDWRHPGLHFDIWQDPVAAGPARLSLAPDRIRFIGQTRLPASVLSAAPWTAGWGFGGEFAIESQELGWNAEAEGSGGAVTALWRGASLKPPDLQTGFTLGEVTIRYTADGAAPGVTVANRGGDVELSGAASTATRAVSLAIQPRAGATPEQLAWLGSHTTGRAGTAYTINFNLPGR